MKIRFDISRNAVVEKLVHVYTPRTELVEGMMTAMTGRSSNNLYTAELQPYNRFGTVETGKSWLPLNYDSETGKGTFILRMEPGVETTPHEHVATEEILVMEGDLVESDGTTFRPGDYLIYEPGTRHRSKTNNGCLILVCAGAYNQKIDEEEIR